MIVPQKLLSCPNCNNNGKYVVSMLEFTKIPLTHVECSNCKLFPATFKVKDKIIASELWNAAVKYNRSHK
jgi:hypothetical protein